MKLGRNSWARAEVYAYLTTETEKSGSGGDVFLYGVVGLYKLKKNSYGEGAVVGFSIFNGIVCPWGMNRRDLNMDPERQLDANLRR